MTRGRFRIAGLAAALVVAFAVPAAAWHRETPPSLRITSGAPHVLPPTRSWDNYQAFPSTADLLQNGSTGRQIYLWNLADFDCNRGTYVDITHCPIGQDPPLPPRPSLMQITESQRQGSPDNGSANSSGRYVTFDADGVYGGGVGGQARRRQIFLLDREKPELLQITQSGAGDSVRPTLNGRTTRTIAFESTAPLLGQNGPPGVRQIFVYFRADRGLLQITAGAGPSSAPMPDGDGLQVVFESTADLLGDGHDTGVSQIFVTTLDKDDHTISQLTQITKGNGPSRRPYISDRRDQIVFESTATDLPGSTPGPGSTIYSTSAGQGSFPSLRQLTGPAFGSCTYPAIDAQAVHISFICTGDPLQNGTTGNRIFLLETDTLPPAPGTFGLPIQLTGRGDVQGPLTHNLGQFFVTFASTADVSDTGGCGPQIQVIDYYTEHPGHWRGASAIGELPPDLLPPLPPDPNEFPPPASNYLGTHMFDLLPTDLTGGSTLEFTTRDGTLIAPTSQGRLEVHLSSHGVNGEASVAVPAAGSFLPPIPVPGFGVMCLQMSGDGGGAVDCDGGRPGGDLLVSQDHDTRFDPLPNGDPNCQAGCAEDGLCHGALGPHVQCLTPTCTGGTVSLCNGPIRVTRTSTLSAGGLQLFLPLRVRISGEASVDGSGVDRHYCTADDAYQPRELVGSLELTTETAAGSIIDADATPGFSLDSTPLTGTPADCQVLKARATSVVRLNGIIPVLDVTTPFGLRDVILGVHLDARSRPLDPRAETSLGDQCHVGLCANDGECVDANPCNGTETCSNAACLPGASLCNDGDSCNGVETCAPATSTCGPGIPPVCDDGGLCTFDTCVPGIGCMHVNPCDDLDECNGTETCDPRTGACSPGTPPVCNDGNACTTDLCNPQFGCEYVNNTAPCSDGTACTSGDACSNGTCVGTPVICTDGSVCNGLETCNPLTGCLPGTALVCNDANPCTDDSCDPLAGCLHTPNAAPCNDGSACTAGDACVAGACSGTPVVLCPDDGDPCNGVEQCNPASGTCGTGPLPNCDDGNVCTDDTCVAGVGCTHTANAAPCDDGNPCTFADACQAGGCVGTVVNCSDANICNGVEVCNPTTAVCDPGVPPNCDDGDPCTADTCDPLAGCVHTPVPNPGCGALVANARIRPITELVQDLSPSSLGGDAAQKRLVRLLHQAEKRLQRARRGTRTATLRRVGAAERRLNAFIALVDTVRASGRMDPALAQRLIDAVARAMADLAAMKASA